MSTLDIKEGQTYVCKRDDLEWWTLDKEYKVQTFGNGSLYLKDDEGYNWYLPNDDLLNSVFKLKEQTYVCKRDDLEWWTLDKEYKVQVPSNGPLYLMDDEGDKWYLPNDDLLNSVFKLKEQTFDLNKLTPAQLKEYAGLLEDKEKAESSLNEFIERMCKQY